MMPAPIFALLLIGLSCTSPVPQQVKGITTDFGYERVQVDSGSFAAYLRTLPLKSKNEVRLFNGKLKSRQDVHEAVIDMEIGKRDLQQCADAVMRLRSEWLYANKRYTQIGFHFVNGQYFPYSKYAQGYRPVFKGNKFTWVKKTEKDYSYSGFRKYLDLVFAYAGTASLIKELKPVETIKSIKIGDVFIQSGNPYGHAVIVLDKAKANDGELRVLLAQSYMPAQEIHILKNFQSRSAWYPVKEGALETPEWIFHSSDLHRFP